jgi:hypothetical protein
MARSCLQGGEAGYRNGCAGGSFVRLGSRGRTGGGSVFGQFERNCGMQAARTEKFPQCGLAVGRLDGDLPGDGQDLTENKSLLLALQEGVIGHIGAETKSTAWSGRERLMEPGRRCCREHFRHRVRRPRCVCEFTGKDVLNVRRRRTSANTANICDGATRCRNITKVRIPRHGNNL